MCYIICVQIISVHWTTIKILCLDLYWQLLFYIHPLHLIYAILLLNCTTKQHTNASFDHYYKCFLMVILLTFHRKYPKPYTVFFPYRYYIFTKLRLYPDNSNLDVILRLFPLLWPTGRWQSAKKYDSRSIMHVIPPLISPMNCTNLDAFSIMADQLWLNTEVFMTFPPAFLYDRAMLFITAHHSIDYPHGSCKEWVLHTVFTK